MAGSAFKAERQTAARVQCSGSVAHLKGGMQVPMADENPDPATSQGKPQGKAHEKAEAKRPLSAAAQRALAEAAQRRAERDRQPSPGAKEYGGPSGPDPTRYGDWEKKGL